MVSLCFARTPYRDHAAPETCDYGFVVNGRGARAKGRNGSSWRYRRLTAGVAAWIRGWSPQDSLIY